MKEILVLILVILLHQVPSLAQRPVSILPVTDTIPTIGASGFASVSIDTPVKGKALIAIMNSTGTVLTTLKMSVDKNTRTLSIDFRSYYPGRYFIDVSQKNKVLGKRTVIK